MGGGGRYPFPKYVWSPLGGWWAEHPNWKRNVGITLVVYAALAVPVFFYSASIERRSPPLRPVPSQRWSTHTLEDDPDYPEKLKDWKENKRPLLERIFPSSEHH